MNEESAVPQPEITPEELAAFYAEQKKLFTVEDLIGYIEDDGVKVPAEEVLAELERDVALWKVERGNQGAQKGAG